MQALPTEGSVRRKIGYKTLSRRNMTFAADPQVNQPYPLGELSYVIVISEIVDWNRMPGVEETFLRRPPRKRCLCRCRSSTRHFRIAYFCLSALA